MVNNLHKAGAVIARYRLIVEKYPMDFDIYEVTKRFNTRKFGNIRKRLDGFHSGTDKLLPAYILVRSTSADLKIGAILREQPGFKKTQLFSINEDEVGLLCDEEVIDCLADTYDLQREYYKVRESNKNKELQLNRIEDRRREAPKSFRRALQKLEKSRRIHPNTLERIMSMYNKSLLNITTRKRLSPKKPKQDHKLKGLISGDLIGGQIRTTKACPFGIAEDRIKFDPILHRCLKEICDQNGFEIVNPDKLAETGFNITIPRFSDRFPKMINISNRTQYLEVSFLIWITVEDGKYIVTEARGKGDQNRLIKVFPSKFDLVSTKKGSGAKWVKFNSVMRPGNEDVHTQCSSAIKELVNNVLKYMEAN